MTRIDHSGHNHPATPAGRAACRKAGRFFAEGDKVRQVDGADVGAVGVITIINPPKLINSDGSAEGGEIRVTFDGIRFPIVRYGYATAGTFIERI